MLCHPFPIYMHLISFHFVMQVALSICAPTYPCASLSLHHCPDPPCIPVCTYCMYAVVPCLRLLCFHSRLLYVFCFHPVGLYYCQQYKNLSIAPAIISFMEI